MNFLFRSVLQLSVCGLICVLQYGCAFGTREVLLKNSDLKERKTAAEDSSRIIVFKDLSDNRQDANIGHVQNAYGIHTADVVAKNSVPEWVNKEIVLQLKNKGFTVVPGDTPLVMHRLKLTGEILKVYTTAYFSYVGEVTVEASFSDSSRTLLTKKYTGHCKPGSNWAASSEMFGETLGKALHETATQIANDADSLLRVAASSTVSAPPDTARPAGSEKIPSAVGTSIVAQGSSAIKDTAPSKFSGKCPNKDNGTVILRGKRDPSVLKEKFTAACSEARLLYNDRVELNRYLGGQVCIHVSIAPDGKVGDIQIVNNTLKDTPVEDKLLGDFSKISFSKYSADSAGTEALFTANFNPSGHDSGKIALAVILGLVSLVTMIITLNNINSFHY